MKRAIILIAVLSSLMLSSCYVRHATYRDGWEPYRWHRWGHDRHWYQADRDYHYKSSYYHNHRPS